MATTTYRYLANDVLETFRQISDDAEIGLTQVVFWINVIANRLRKQHIDKIHTGTHLVIFQNVPVSIEPNSNRKYFDLPKSIYDFGNDRGIDYITYQDVTDCCEGPAFTEIMFSQTSVRDSRTLYYDPYQTPVSTNPFFYRIKNRVYMLGLECIDVPSGLEMGLYTTIDITESGCNLDDPVDLDDELITILKYEVLNLGRFALIIPNERINEGSDQTTQAIRANQIEVPAINQPKDYVRVNDAQQQAE